MNKKILFAYFLMIQASFGALPPTTMKGQSESAKATTFNFQVPYNQSTSTAGATKLIETDNQNLLLNASFENTTVDASWTSSAGTDSADTTNIIDGLKALSISLSSVNGTIITQSVTPTIQTLGVNMESGMWVKTSLTTIQVCAIQASTEISCVNAPSTNTWSYVVVNAAGPANGTAVGVRLKTSSSSSGTVIADRAYVGVARNLSQVSQAQTLGTATVTGCSG